jgi:hypothetical protein
VTVAIGEDRRLLVFRHGYAYMAGDYMCKPSADYCFEALSICFGNLMLSYECPDGEKGRLPDGQGGIGCSREAFGANPHWWMGYLNHQLTRHSAHRSFLSSPSTTCHVDDAATVYESQYSADDLTVALPTGLPDARATPPCRYRAMFASVSPPLSLCHCDAGQPLISDPLLGIVYVAPSL